MGKIGKQNSMPDSGAKKWLLLFYTVPSKPVNARMKIWRKLAKAGAVQLKSAVYILPGNEENYELCQWLVTEVASLKGEGAFVNVDKIETMKDADIIALFNSQREKDYTAIEKNLDELERKVSSVRKGAGLREDNKLSDQLNKRLREFEEVRRIDFFSSARGTELKRKIEFMKREMQGISKFGERRTPEIFSRSIDDYHGKSWVTRKRPFVDRMASAWLIKKFIDRDAAFGFISEQEVEDLNKNSVAFDIRGGEFTHIGDLCTFEVLVKTFGFKDKAVRKIAAIVHELDIKDEKYSNPEAKGIEDILKGIRATAKDDFDILEKGMAVFEMLYASGS